MLLSKSVLYQIGALFLLPLILCQKYNSDYRVTDDVDSDYTSGYYSDEPAKKDYSKYYNAEQSSPISIVNSEVKDDDSGFVKPLDFSGLFGPSSFGFGIASSPVKSGFSVSPDIVHPFGLDTAASTQNHSGFVSPNEFKSVFDIVSSASEVGFRSQDFLPSSTKTSEIKNEGFFSSNFNKYDEMPGPSYISHKVPSSEAYKHITPQSPVFNKDNFELREDTKNSKKYKLNDEYTDRKPSSESYETKSGYKAPSYSTDFDSTKIPYVNVSPKNSNTYSSKTKYSSEPQQGTNSYSVRPTLNTLSAKPSYYPQQDSTSQSKYQQSTLTPYKKYSFQPTQFYSDIGSTVLPFESKIASTAASYLSSPIRTDTELVPKKICKKIEKQLTPDEISQGRFRRQAMTCYVCTDPKSGGSFEQCSYTSEPNQKEYFVGSAQKYNSNETPSTFRYKRYTETTSRNEEESEIGSGDSYGYEKPKSPKYKSRPREFDEEAYRSPDFKEFYEAEDDKYRFGPEYFSFDPEVGDREKSSSELHLEELQKSGENCKKVNRDSMTCMICENPKTGGNYEQCSYTSEPKEKKYAYVKESKFDGNDPVEEKIVESTEEKPTVTSKQQNKRKPSRQRARKPSQTNHDKSEDLCEEVKKESMTCKVCKNLRTGAKSEQCSYRSTPNKKQYAYVNERNFNSKDHPNVDRVEEGTEHRPIKTNKQSRQTTPEETYEIPSHFAEETERRERHGVKLGGLGLDPELYGKPITFDEKKEEASEGSASYHANPTKYEDYFSKLFPEYADIKREEGEHGEASEQKELPADYFNDESKKDVEEVLAEFAAKDRSNCKKVSKGKLTCFLCVDEKGMKNEECMYVTESQPKSSHMAYHQKKNFRSVSPHKPNKIQESESQVSSDTQSLALSNAHLPTAISSEMPLLASTALPIRKRKGFFKKASSSTETPVKNINSGKTTPRIKTLKQFSSKIIPETITNAPHTSTLSHGNAVNKKVPRIARRTTNIKPQNITDSVAASSGTHYVYQKPESKQGKRIAAASSKQNKTKISKQRENKTRPSKESDEPELPIPKEFDVHGSEGAFSSELKPMYSKKLGVTLPAFMLVRSEHEASFDESVASGK